VEHKKASRGNILVRRKEKQTYKGIVLWLMKQISEVYLQGKRIHIES